MYMYSVYIMCHVHYVIQIDFNIFAYYFTIHQIKKKKIIIFQCPFQKIAKVCQWPSLNYLLGVIFRNYGVIKAFLAVKHGCWLVLHAQEKTM
jgi:hypothetical protein